MASRYDPAFDALVSAGPNVDMIGDSRMEYDGPRCDGCGDAVETDDATCEECAPCSTCHGAGGWQQPDGLIVECPRGCMTGGSTPASCGSCEHSLAWHVQPGGCTIGDCPCLGGAA